MGIMNRGVSIVLLTACWAGFAAAVPDIPCAVQLNFFPAASDIGDDVTAPVDLGNGSMIEKPCSGPYMSCAFPSPWLKAQQSAAFTALPGRSLSAGPLKIAVKEYTPFQPVIYFVPSSALLSEGSDVSACMSAEAAAATKRRSLQQSAPQFKVTRAASWTYSIRYSNDAAIQGSIVGNAGVVTIPANSQGEDCAAITVSLLGYAIDNSSHASLASPASVTHSVCWYKANGQAMADLAFNPEATCKTGTVTVNVSSVSPLAQNLTQNGSTVVVAGEQQLLMQPVLHIWGALNTTLDGTVLDQLEYDEFNQPTNYINKYIFLPMGLKPTDTLTITLDDGKLQSGELEEGYYRMFAKISVMSKFPQLVDLQGKTAIAQTDITNVQGYTEYMAMLLVNGSDPVVPMVPLQLNTTQAAIAAISSNKIGRSIMDGENVTFTWQFVGTGRQQCYHDEQLLPGPCRSPMTVVARSVESTSSINHVFRVEFTDVCGNQKNATYMYTQQGVTTLTKIDYIPVTALADSKPASGPKAGAGRKSSSSAGQDLLAVCQASWVFAGIGWLMMTLLIK